MTSPPGSTIACKQSCIIVPCYNESSRLDLARFREFTDNHANVRFLFVNDGSTDDTAILLTDFSASTRNVYVLDMHRNAGKAEAVRAGMIHGLLDSDISFIGYWDAD